MFERYTEEAKRAVFFAHYEASRFGSPEITSAHLLLGLMRGPKLLFSRAQADSIRKHIEAKVEVRQPIPSSIDLPLGKECKRVLAKAAEEAERLRHEHFGNEHLLLGLLAEQESPVGKILKDHGLKLADLRGKFARTGERAQPRSKPLERVLERFHWEKSPIAQRDALFHRATGQVMLNAGQRYDSARFKLVHNAWRDFCADCLRDLFVTSAPKQSFGYKRSELVMSKMLQQACGAET